MTHTIELQALDEISTEALGSTILEEPEICSLVFSEDDVVVTYLGRIARGRVTQMSANFMKPASELADQEEQSLFFRPNYGEIRQLPGNHAAEIGHPATWIIAKSYITDGTAIFETE